MRRPLDGNALKNVSGCFGCFWVEDLGLGVNAIFGKRKGGGGGRWNWGFGDTLGATGMVAHWSNGGYNGEISCFVWVVGG